MGRLRSLAKKAGVAQRTVELALKDIDGRSVGTMRKICRALGISLVYLLEPSLPWEDGDTGRRKRVYTSLTQEVLDVLSRRAEEIGISRSEYIASILEQSVRLYRVMCGECEGVFWVERERGWNRCPYCGQEEEMFEEPTVD